MNIAIFRHHSMIGYETYAINASPNHHLRCCDVICNELSCRGDGEGKDVESHAPTSFGKRGAPLILAPAKKNLICQTKMAAISGPVILAEQQHPSSAIAPTVVSGTLHPSCVPRSIKLAVLWLAGRAYNIIINNCIVLHHHHQLAVVSSNFLFGHYYQSVIGNTSKI